uniref:UBX domain-containing protein n=1 Tax=Rhodosorus marinus TaxID=101924 RepID=A0A7S3ADD2_9RHOD|mmetsp:Transcript_9450/g.40897  ORF Transcript_9450/g.40897 Transcript_9450/m.40897 type:complete len:617 (+) Transcript_9450:49-1899(+)
MITVELSGLGYPGKKVKVSTTPTTPLSKVRDEACAKVKLDAAGYGLVREKDALDLSLPIRLSNLPGNCTVQLVRINKNVSKKVKIALDVALGGTGGSRRFVREHKSNETLWELLVETEKELGPGALTAMRSGDGKYMKPVLTFMNRQVDGNLHETTLNSLGLSSGSVLLRLRYEKTETPIEEMLPKLEEQSAAAAGARKSQASQAATSPQTSKTAQTQASTEQNRVPSKAHPGATGAGPNLRNSGSTAERSQQKVLDWDLKAPVASDAAPSPPKVLDWDRKPPVRTDSVPSQPKVLDWDNTPGPQSSSPSTRETTGPRTSTLEWDKPGSQTASSSSQVAHPVIQWDAQPAAGGPSGASQVGTTAGRKVPSSPESERDLRVYRASESQTDISRFNIPEAFYRFQETDLRHQLADSARRHRQNDNAVLMTRAMREKENAKKRDKYKKCLVRIRLPDRTCIQGTFWPSDSISIVYKFVRSNLKEQDLDFYLYDTPPRRRMGESSEDLWSLGLVPATLLYLTFEGEPLRDQSAQALLAPQAMQRMEELPKVEIPVPEDFIKPQENGHIARTIHRDIEGTDSDGMDVDDEREARRLKTAQMGAKPVQPSDGKKVPKWFRKM